MSVRALVFDIDGTLLTSKGVMSRRVYDALLECRRRGCLLSVATARAGRLVFRDYEIPGDASLLLERGVVYNGGTVFDRAHRFYQHTPIPGDVVNEIARAASEYSDELQIAIQHDDIYHAFRYPMSAVELRNWGFNGKDIWSFEECRHRAATKLMIFRGTAWQKLEGDLSPLFAQLQERFGPQVNLALSDSKRSVYVVSCHSSKGTGIQRLTALHGIAPEEVAVFGDDTSDAGMFGMFGHSIAMGNAVESLKAIATHVTGTNDEDGIVQALRKHLQIY